MKVSADFYTPDEADHAAGAVKSYVPMALDVRIGSNGTASGSGQSVNVICRREDSAEISHILVNRGGHNITLG